MINLSHKTPKILVIGDLIIDNYLWGSCERISPEAPVQIVNIDNESSTLGGAGNDEGPEDAHEGLRAENGRRSGDEARPDCGQAGGPGGDDG